MTSESDSGILTILLCFASLIFAGVFLSLLADKRAAGSSETNDKIAEISKNEEDIKRLRALVTSANLELENSAGNIETQQVEILAAENLRQNRREEVRQLRMKLVRSGLRRKKLEREYEEYILSYKNLLWHRSRGARIDYIVLKSGRKLNNVIIMNVGAEGILLSHTGGVARLSVADLSLTMRKRFQLNLLAPEPRR
ncbi:hypothetical protein [Luteolibacter sp. AS25]|uniref:hypothetical protein n=1 Tax=Luteolibacter sp. AS25 TaxID=3135776 RepID=UPI00398B5247